MKMILRTLLATFAVMALTITPVAAQTYSPSTTLSTAVTSPSTTTLALTAVTNVVAISPSSTGTNTPTQLFIDREEMTVLSVNTTLKTVVVQRGVDGTGPAPHSTSATVIITPASAIVYADPQLACPAVLPAYLPLINVTNGNVWLCRSNVWKATNVTVLTTNSILLTP